MTARRLAACDPCRSSKVACDHRRPVCTRCREGGRDRSKCTYRTTPFKKRKHRDSPDLNSWNQLTPQDELAARADSLTSRSVPQLSASRHSSVSRVRYPNPGYQGPSSHAAIFSQVASTPDYYEAPPTGRARPSSSYPITSSKELSSSSVDTERELADCFRTLQSQWDLSKLHALLNFWLAKGTNLALAEPVVLSCINRVLALEKQLPLNDPGAHSNLLLQLLRSSDAAFDLTESCTIKQYVEQICGEDMRLETLGIYACAISRATIDIPFFPPLYTTDKDRCALQQLSAKFCDRVVDLCLSLDCLNDIQVILQYERFMLDSNLSGDQSFSAWRHLGDVIASALALGYHENISAKHGLPNFLVELRMSAFARVYNSDKSFAIFLGRAPRMSKRFAHIQMPVGRCDWDAPPEAQTISSWATDIEPSYRAEARWSMLCATMKEDILELLLGPEEGHRKARANDVKTRLEAAWHDLPPAFRLTGKLKHCKQTPFARDFFLAVRLTYLHTCFLIRLVLLRSWKEVDAEMARVSEEMLSLVIEGILQRDNLANAGSGILWKIAQFALPAAGIILLRTLQQQQRGLAQFKYPGTYVRRDLSILVVEINLGTIIDFNNPNYNLLMTATKTIQGFLESLECESAVVSHDTIGEGEQNSGRLQNFMHLPPDPWTLETGFWEDMAEHPFLCMDTNLSDFVPLQAQE